MGDLPNWRYPDPRVEALDKRFTAKVGNAAIERIATGFRWAEGPAYFRAGRFLLFSDIPNNRIVKWQEGKEPTDFLKPVCDVGGRTDLKEPGSNGLTLDRQGHLIAAEHGDRRVSRFDWTGGKRTVADNWQGKRFNSPNDVIVKSNGDIYFTDPPYGLPKIVRTCRVF